VTFVETHRDTFGVAPLLAAIGEPVSTFYDRVDGKPSARAVADAAVAERIEAIWERSRRTYGAPRIHAMLAREGIRVGRKRVERLMRHLGIQGAHLHKHWRTTRQDRDAAAAPDLVDRNFTAAEPNRLWVADLTYIKTLQGILYLAVVLDVFSRKVVGWQMADRMTTDLVLSALEMGLWRREVVRDRLIHHSDKGSQYTSLRFTQRLADAGVAPSTGSVGDSFDNAVAESFFGSLKTELIYRHSWASRHDAELAIFAWIEGWYNPERLIAGLGMRSPDEYEAAFYAPPTPSSTPPSTLETTYRASNKPRESQPPSKATSSRSPPPPQASTTAPKQRQQHEIPHPLRQQHDHRPHHRTNPPSIRTPPTPAPTTGRSHGPWPKYANARCCAWLVPPWPPTDNFFDGQR
jgi:putative transposase